MELSRLLLLALLGLSTGYVSRPGLAMRPAMRPAATLRPAAPMNPALTRMMAEETAEDAVAANEVCIEDEAIEECVLASWDAGKLAVPMSWVQQGKLKARTTQYDGLLSAPQAFIDLLGGATVGTTVVNVAQ